MNHDNVKFLFKAMIRGEDDRILAAIDSSGRRCGFDSNLIDVPYLFIHDLSSCINVHNILIGCMSESVSYYYSFLIIRIVETRR